MAIGSGTQVCIELLLLLWLERALLARILCGIEK